MQQTDTETTLPPRYLKAARIAVIVFLALAYVAGVPATVWLRSWTVSYEYKHWPHLFQWATSLNKRYSNFIIAATVIGTSVGVVAYVIKVWKTYDLEKVFSRLVLVISFAWLALMGDIIVTVLTARREPLYVELLGEARLTARLQVDIVAFFVFLAGLLYVLRRYSQLLYGIVEVTAAGFVNFAIIRDIVSNPRFFKIDLAHGLALITSLYFSQSRNWQYL
jgi:hypothetical protein